MGGPHDAPDPRQLVEAVREFLQAEVLPGAEGGTRFHTLVAVNVLGMVERELELGPAHARAHAERLAGLGCTDDADLAAAIRTGALDDRYDELKAALTAAVLDKLAVGHPGYADL